MWCIIWSRLPCIQGFLGMRRWYSLFLRIAGWLSHSARIMSIGLTSLRTRRVCHCKINRLCIRVVLYTCGLEESRFMLQCIVHCCFGIFSDQSRKIDQLRKVKYMKCILRLWDHKIDLSYKLIEWGYIYFVVPNKTNCAHKSSWCLYRCFSLSSISEYSDKYSHILRFRCCTGHPTRMLNIYPEFDYRKALSLDMRRMSRYRSS